MWGRSLRPQSGWERLGDDALAVERGGDSQRISKIRPGGGRLNLPGEGSPHVLLAGKGPGQLLGGAGEVASGVLLLLEFGERGSLAIVLPVLVEGAVPLGVGVVPGGVADGAPVSPEHGAGHQTGGVLHGVATVHSHGLTVRQTELAVVQHGGFLEENEKHQLADLRTKTKAELKEGKLTISLETSIVYYFDSHF